jgi:hypothetical protein
VPNPSQFQLFVAYPLLPDTLDEDGGVIGGEHDGDGLVVIFDVAVQGSGASKQT